MAVFTYSALKNDGTTASGELTANDRADAFRRLDRSGLQPLSLKQKDGAASATSEKKNGKEMVATKEEKKPKDDRKAKSAALAKAGAKPAAKEAEAKEAVPTGPVKLKKADIITFTEELSDLLAAGLQLEPALRIMESRDELTAVKDVTAILRNRIRDGSSFSSSLSIASPSFGELYCNLAAAG